MNEAHVANLLAESCTRIAKGEIAGFSNLMVAGTNPEINQAMVIQAYLVAYVDPELTSRHFTVVVGDELQDLSEIPVSDVLAYQIIKEDPAVYSNWRSLTSTVGTEDLSWRFVGRLMMMQKLPLAFLAFGRRRHDSGKFAAMYCHNMIPPTFCLESLKEAARVILKGRK